MKGALGFVSKDIVQKIFILRLEVKDGIINYFVLKFSVPLFLEKLKFLNQFEYIPWGTIFKTHLIGFKNN